MPKQPAASSVNSLSGFLHEIANIQEYSENYIFSNCPKIICNSKENAKLKN